MTINGQNDNRTYQAQMDALTLAQAQANTGQWQSAVGTAPLPPRQRLMHECQEHAKVLRKRIAEYEAGKSRYDADKAELEAVMTAVSALAGNGASRMP